MVHGYPRMLTVFVLLAVSIFSGSFAQADSGNVNSDKGGAAMVEAQGAGKPQTGAAEDSIILIGASYAAGLKMDTLAGRKVLNKGVGGEQSFETLARFDQEVIALKPDAVIMWGFINDIFRADREKVDVAIERIKSSYIEMIKRASENGITPIVATEVTMSLRPGFKAWAMSLLPRIMGKTSYQDYINGQVMQVNHWLTTYANENGILLLDLQAVLADDGVMRKATYSQADGSHISDEGYRLLAEYIRAKVITL